METTEMNTDMLKPCIIETTDPNTLLNSLTDGDNVKATWLRGKHALTVEGPVYIVGEMYCWGYTAIRWADGEIESTLTSIEVTRDEEVTATRDEEDALNALLDSLKDGQEVTAELRYENWSLIATGPVGSVCAGLRVLGPSGVWLRFASGKLPESLHSVTVRRTITHRWERDGDESLSSRTH